MTDYTDLIERLRKGLWPVDRCEVSDALEAQARRIAELEQVSAMVCDRCGWAMKFPGEECRNCSCEKQADRIAELEATIWKFQLVEKALNYFLEKDTPHTWRYRREEAEELARAALEKKDG